MLLMLSLHISIGEKLRTKGKKQTEQLSMALIRNCLETFRLRKTLRFARDVFDSAPRFSIDGSAVVFTLNCAANSASVWHEILTRFQLNYDIK